MIEEQVSGKARRDGVKEDMIFGEAMLHLKMGG